MPTPTEIEAALAAVSAAADLTAAAQGRLQAGDTLTKTDDSPVTVADFAAQAVVAGVLTERLGPVAMIGEEDADELGEQADLLAGVTQLVSAHRGDSSSDRVLEWVGVGRPSVDVDRYWTLDPIDGTKGFLRGDQYAIALALIEDGEVVLGVMGCPNLPNEDGSTGAIFGATDAGSFRLVGDERRPVKVAAPASLAEARVCESVESGHSDHDQSAQIVERLGITAAPYRIDSQCKYAAVARGDASIYLRLPTRPGYQEKIWDHAAGKFVVERAGGRVTDVDGQPLDFGHGARLSENAGVVATDGHFHDRVIEAVRTVLNR